MTVLVHDPHDNDYTLIDPINRKFTGWHLSKELALSTPFKHDGASAKTIPEFINYTQFEILNLYTKDRSYTLDEARNEYPEYFI